MADKKELRKRISSCKIFSVLATNNYLKYMKDENSDVSIQIKIAREMKLPLYLIIDRRLKEDQMMYIRNYFSNDNIVKETIIDIGNKNSVKIVALEMKNLVRCMEPEYKDIRLVTPYSEEDILQE